MTGYSVSPQSRRGKGADCRQTELEKGSTLGDQVLEQQGQLLREALMPLVLLFFCFPCILFLLFKCSSHTTV